MNTPVKTVAEVLEDVVIRGDLDALTPEQRTEYYNRVCETLGLNPLTGPFAYIRLQGRLQLYAKKDATDQLRKINRVSVIELHAAERDGICVVTAHVEDATGRKDCATGAVSIAGLRGEALANGMMKAETKAKRRATLSVCGLGFLDESELEDIPELRRFTPRARPNAMLAVPERAPGDGEGLPPPVPPTADQAAPVDSPPTAGAAPYPSRPELSAGLAKAAEQGMKALQEYWLLLPGAHQKALKPELDRRHKPRARAVDAMTQMKGEP